MWETVITFNQTIMLQNAFQGVLFRKTVFLDFFGNWKLTFFQTQGFTKIDWKLSYLSIFELKPILCVQWHKQVAHWEDCWQHKSQHWRLFVKRQPTSFNRTLICELFFSSLLVARWKGPLALKWHLISLSFEHSS